MKDTICVPFAFLRTLYVLLRSLVISRKAFPYVYLSLIIFLTEVGLESQGTATFMSTTFEGMKNRKNCVRLNYKKLMSVAQQTNKVTKVMLRIIRVTTNPKETFLSMTRNNWRQRLLV